MDLEEEKKPVKGKDGFLKGFLSGVLLCAIAALLVLCLWKQDEVTQKKQISDEEQETGGSNIAEISEKLNYIDGIIDQYYYGAEVEDSEIREEVYKAYVAALHEKYTTYYTAEELKSMSEQLQGQYCGIGSVVTQSDNGEIVIVMPYENSPAAEAGLQPGDVLVSMDGTLLADMELDEAITYVRGEEGSKGTFQVRRGEEEFEVEITRKKVDIPSVKGELLEGDIAYIVIGSFDENTDEQFEKILNSLLDQGAKGIVFDIRNNGGGLLDTVVNISDQLLSKQLVLYMEDKYQNRKNYYTEEGSIDENIPMAVIINENSASASEVFAGALQDYKRAKIFGTKSYGKGVVQNMIPFEDGSGMKLTVANYFTPLGRNFTDNGIDPDEAVEMPTEEEAYNEQGYLKDEYDAQKIAAVEYIESMITGSDAQ